MLIIQLTYVFRHVLWMLLIVLIHGDKIVHGHVKTIVLPGSNTMIQEFVLIYVQLD